MGRTGRGPRGAELAAGLVLGAVLDVVFGDPRRGHPVALFGSLAARVERATYRSSRAAGARYVAVLVGGTTTAAALVGRRLPTSESRAAVASRVAATAAVTWVVLGGTSLRRAGRDLAADLRAADLGAADLRVTAPVDHEGGDHSSGVGASGDGAGGDGASGVGARKEIPSEFLGRHSDPFTPMESPRVPVDGVGGDDTRGDGSDGGDDGLAAARARLPTLCGRDPTGLDASAMARGGIESVAENTADAVVGPLLWGAVAGLPGLVGYRAVNTLDAMVGYRNDRYLRFGWAAARLDDVATLLPARVAAVLTWLCAPVVDGSGVDAFWVTRRDGRSHPSPNAGQVEAAFAGALGVRLGGELRYPHGVEHRPQLGFGRLPQADDLDRSAALSGAVSAASVVLAAVVALSRPAAGRAARRLVHGRSVRGRGGRGKDGLGGDRLGGDRLGGDRLGRDGRR